MKNLKGHVKINDIESFLKLLDGKITRVEDTIDIVEYNFNKWCEDTYAKRFFRKDRTLEECRDIGLSDKWNRNLWEYQSHISYLRETKRNLNIIFKIATNSLAFGDELNVSFEDYYLVFE